MNLNERKDVNKKGRQTHLTIISFNILNINYNRNYSIWQKPLCLKGTEENPENLQ